MGEDRYNQAASANVEENNVKGGLNPDGTPKSQEDEVKRTNQEKPNQSVPNGARRSRPNQDGFRKGETPTDEDEEDTDESVESK